MEGAEEEVREAIKEPYPLCIFQDKDYSNRQVYYRQDKSKSYYIKAVVDFSDKDYGELITRLLQHINI